MLTVTAHHGPFLLMVGTGDADVCDIFGLIDMASRLAAMKPYRRVLLDLISVNVRFSPEQHRAVGTHLAVALSGAEKVAVVVNQRLRVGTGERAAVNAGLNLKTFVDLREATVWLEG